MSSFETADTEETATCLYITVYHPSQEEKPVFSDLNFCARTQLRADDVVKFGRDFNVCHFNFVDLCVSRIQFALQFFRHFSDTKFGFEIKNLSKKVKLTVNNIELGYLNKVDLPETCIVLFGEYQMRMEQQGGESENYFEVRFELAKESLLQEKQLLLKQPVLDYGMLHSDSPVEIDENE